MCVVENEEQAKKQATQEQIFVFLKAAPSIVLTPELMFMSGSGVRKGFIKCVLKAGCYAVSTFVSVFEWQFYLEEQ